MDPPFISSLSRRVVEVEGLYEEKLNLVNHILQLLLELEELLNHLIVLDVLHLQKLTRDLLKQAVELV